MPRLPSPLRGSPLQRVRQLLAALALLSTAAGAASSPAAPPVPAPPPAAGPAVPALPVGAAAHPSKVLVIVEENHGAASASAGMPYLASLGRTYGVATNYHAASHPSLPNYLAIAGGSTFGIADDSGPAAHAVRGPSVFDVALAHGQTAKTYAEAMPTACAQSATSRYAVKHNPWAYFADPTSRASCRRFDVPAGTTSAGALHDDVAAGRLPTVAMVVPDICHDAHDCSLATADAWLHDWMAQIQAGPDFRAGRLAVVITFDEDEGRTGNQVLTTVVAPQVHGVRSGAALSHYSLTRYAAELAGGTAPGNGRTAGDLRSAFGL